MKWCNNLTFRYLKENKKRTIVTIIGIILSISLMCGITTIMESYRAMEENNAIEDFGNAHAVFEEVKKENIGYITKDSRVKNFSVKSNIGQIRIPNEEMKFGLLSAYDKNAFDMLSIKLIEGRKPENSNEVIISENLMTALGKVYKVGDKIELDIGDTEISENTDEESPKDEKTIFNFKEKKEYNVVGIIERSYTHGNIAITYLNASGIKNDEVVSVAVLFKDIKNIYEFAPEIAASAKMEKYEANEGQQYIINYNENLLRLYGESKYNNVNSGLGSIVAIVVILIAIITIATIYNSFNISILERKKQFGILSSLGATEGQIKGMVKREAIIMSLIAIPFGVIIGTMGVKLLFNIVVKFGVSDIFESNNIEIAYSLKGACLGVILGLITIYISALLPARNAAKISPIEAIRNSGDFKVKRVRRNILISKLFKIEGELAYKNLKRNRKKFRITLFSLVISVIIFLTFSGYIKLMMKSNDLYRGEEKGDFIINSNNEFISTDIVDEMRSIDGVKKISYRNSIWGNIKLSKEDINENLPQEFKDLYVDENLLESNSSELCSIGNENIKDLKISEGSFDIEEANKENGVILVGANKFEMPGKRVEIRLTNHKVGDIVSIYEHRREGDLERKFKILAIANEAPAGLMDLYGSQMGFITTDEIVQSIKKDNSEYSGGSSKIVIEASNIENARKGLNEIVEKNKYNKDVQLNLFDAEQDDKEGRTIQNIINAFVYTFIFIISMIAITNVINTISTNFQLRKREFAMIQSMGITPGGFKKMVYLESIYYSIFAMIYGVPLSIGLTVLMHRAMADIISFKFIFPYEAILIAAVVLTIVSLVSVYIPMKKLERESIIENIRDENS